MLHAVAFDNRRARYRNRFVSSAVIGILHHADQLLALGEVEPAWMIAPDLDTIGPWTAGTDAPLPMGAHNRVHPATGDLFALAYDPMAPVVHMNHIVPADRLKRSFDVAPAAPLMIHDFVLTERHLVLLVGPAVFDMAAMMRGEPMLAWRPEIGTTDGWLATYVYHPKDATSDLVLLDAAAPDAAPVAVIRMPQRVPAGLHGSGCRADPDSGAGPPVGQPGRWSGAHEKAGPGAIRPGRAPGRSLPGRLWGVRSSPRAG